MDVINRKLKMQLSEDKKTLNLSLTTSLIASEVETLISDLAELRANMLPPVPFERPNPNDENSPARLLVQNEPSFMAKLLKDGRIRFWLRNNGLGWLAFNFTINQAITLREYLNCNTPKDDGLPNLFRDDGSDRSAH